MEPSGRNSEERRVQQSNSGVARLRTILFARSGEYWTLGPEGAQFSLKDVKGLGYIQRLLQHPGEEFHALDLLGESAAPLPNTSRELEAVALLREGSGSNLRNLGDAGAMLDPRAKQEYGVRLRELKDEFERLQGRGDEEGAARIESEIDFLIREIKRAVGLGGRDRRAGSVAERARLNVQRAIKSGLQKISEFDTELGGLLDRCIRTGSFCSFIEEGQVTIDWRFAIDGSKPIIEPVETEPALVSRHAGFSDSPDRTKFVGRELERSILRRRLDQAKAGSGIVVTISGPPGIGKTRLARELCKEAANMGFTTLEGACYYDRGEMVPFNPFVEILEAASELWSSADSFRRVLGDDAAELARLMPQLRRKFPDIPPLLEVAPEQSRRMLLNAFLEFLIRLGSKSPLLLLIDDLHWGDEGSLSLLSHISRSISKIPLVMVGTYRDNKLDQSPDLDSTLDSCTRLHVLEPLYLGSLSEAATAEMIAVLSGREPPKPVVDVIYSGSEGNPFFIEELVHHLAERGKLIASDGEFNRELNRSDIAASESVKLMISRRLARLSDPTRKFLETAAVIERSFTFAMFEASTEANADLLLDSLEEAEAAGLISSRLEHPDALFQFSHELVRQVVLVDLSAPRRQRLHLRIADAIERIYSRSPEDKISDLAYHLWHAGTNADPARTVECLMKAAKQARVQSAYATALSHLRNALECARELKPGAGRDEKELEFYLEYLSVVRLTNRWTTSEAGAIYMRARELCERSGQTSRMCKLLQGSALFHLGRGELALAQDYAERIVEISRSSSQPESAISGNYILGHALFCLGDLVSAHDHLAEAVRLRDSMPASVSAGRSAKIYSLVIDAQVVWMLGYPDRAEALAKEGVRAAQESDNRLAETFALTQYHVLVMFRREFGRALEIADRALRIATEKQFEWLKTSIIWSMEACKVLGTAERTIDRARKDFETYFASEAKLYMPTNCTVLAEGFGVLGQVEAGISVIEQAFAAMQETGEKMTEPETWRVKASLLQQLAVAPSTPAHRAQSLREEGEECLRTAIKTSEIQASKIWELRAAVDLARLLKNSRRETEALSLLRSTYEWFTEGFDTPDLARARALLAELSA